MVDKVIKCVAENPPISLRNDGGGKTPTPTESSSSSENESSAFQGEITPVNKQPSFKQTYILNRQASQEFKGSFEDLVNLNQNVSNNEPKEPISEPPSPCGTESTERQRSDCESLTIEMEPSCLMQETAFKEEPVFFETCTLPISDSAKSDTVVVQKPKITKSATSVEEKKPNDTEPQGSESSDVLCTLENESFDNKEPVGIIEPSWNQTFNFNNSLIGDSSPNHLDDLVHLNFEAGQSHRPQYIFDDNDKSSSTPENVMESSSSPKTTTVESNSMCDNVLKSQSPVTTAEGRENVIVMPESDNVIVTSSDSIVHDKSVEVTYNTADNAYTANPTNGSQMVTDIDAVDDLQLFTSSIDNEKIISSPDSSNLESIGSTPVHDRTVPVLSISHSEDTDSSTGSDDDDRDSDVSSDENNTRIGGYNISAISDSDDQVNAL